MLRRLSPWLLVGLTACASMNARSCGERTAEGEPFPGEEDGGEPSSKGRDGGAPDTAIACVGEPPVTEDGAAQPDEAPSQTTSTERTPR